MVRAPRVPCYHRWYSTPKIVKERYNYLDTGLLSINFDKRTTFFTTRGGEAEAVPNTTRQTEGGARGPDWAGAFVRAPVRAVILTRSRSDSDGHGAKGEAGWCGAKAVQGCAIQGGCQRRQEGQGQEAQYQYRCFGGNRRRSFGSDGV